MNNPVRITRNRQDKQVSPNGLPIVYVGRPTKWGNPFTVNGRTAEEAVQLYTAWLDMNESLKEKIVLELRGKNLCCWCRAGEPCHADVLLEIANK